MKEVEIKTIQKEFARTADTKHSNSHICVRQHVLWDVQGAVLALFFSAIKYQSLSDDGRARLKATLQGFQAQVQSFNSRLIQVGPTIT